MSAPTPTNGAPAKLLNSWKEIADYLGVTVRTAQSWEAERSLPVMRGSGAKSRVCAESGELDRWRDENLRNKTSWWNRQPFLRRYAVAATIVLIAAAAATAASQVRRHWKGPPSTLRLEANSLVVIDRDGRELWRKTFENPFQSGDYSEAAAAGNPRSWIGNLDGDRGMETLFVYQPVDRDRTGATLFCFAEDGREKWRFRPGRSIASESGPVPRNFTIASFLVRNSTHAGLSQVLVTSHHASGHANQFAVLASDGKLTGEYWHAGRLPVLDYGDVDGDGRDEILLAGVDDDRRQATLLALDPSRLPSMSGLPRRESATPGAPRQQPEKWVLLFPRTCLNLKFERSNSVSRLVLRDGFVEVAVAERHASPDSVVYYTLARDLSLTQVRFSETLWSSHRDLESSHMLDHKLSAAEVEALRSAMARDPADPSS